jgi:hypothetical protein
MCNIHVLAKRLHCNGEAYLPIEDCEDSQGCMSTRYAPCPTCDRSGKPSQWIDSQTLLYCCTMQIAHTSTLPIRAICISAAAIRRPLNLLLADRFFSSCRKPSKMFMLHSGEVETVKVHDFVPHRYKVLQELLLGVLPRVDFRQGSELGVRTED